MRFDDQGNHALLTPEIMGTWLEEGVPSHAELVRIYGLTRWGDLIATFTIRDAAISAFGFAIPSKEAIEAIAAASPLVEVGAGTGFWSALVARAGADIIACDSCSDTHHTFKVGTHHPVERIDAVTFVRAHPDRDVLMVWPSYAKSWAEEVARAMQPGRTLFLVSEGNGGAIADDGLFEYLDTDFEEIEDIELPVWPGMRDDLRIRRKKSGN